jgi:hypothetical protein
MGMVWPGTVLLRNWTEAAQQEGWRLAVEHTRHLEIITTRIARIAGALKSRFCLPVTPFRIRYIVPPP